MKPVTIQLASTNHQAVLDDVHKVLPTWDGVEQHYSGKYNDSHVSLVIVPDGWQIEPEYDEEGNVTTEGVPKGEFCVDLVADPGTEFPEFETSVTPANPRHKFWI